MVTLQFFGGWEHIVALCILAFPIIISFSVWSYYELVLAGNFFITYFDMQHYMLGDGKGIESVEKIEVKIPVDSASENVVTEKTEETPAVTKEATEAAPTAAEEIIEVTSAASQEAIPAAKDISEATPDAAEESSNNVEEENSGDQEVEHTSEIKVSMNK